MKIHYRLIVLSLLFCSMFGTINAQKRDNDQRTWETKVADIIMLLPTQDSKTFNLLMSELSELNTSKELVPYLSTLLSDPGKSDDSKIRYALSGLAFYQSQSGKEKESKSFAHGFCKALQQASSVEIKDFLLIQLQYIAGDESIDVVKSFLSDNKLYDPAVRILSQIGTEAAGAALLDALAPAGEKQKTAIAEALGDAAYAPAIDAITHLLGNGNLKLHKTALHTLAELAEPASGKLLAEWAQKAGYAYESTDALGSYILYLSKLLKKGKKQEVAQASAKLLKNIQNAGPAKCSALTLLIQSGNEQQAISESVKALSSQNKAYRTAALQASLSIASPDMTLALLKKAEKEKNPEVISEIIYNLGARGAQTALPFLQKSIQSKQTSIVKEAIGAIAQLAPEQAADFILPVINTKDGALIATAQEVLLTLPGGDLESKIATVVPSASPEAQAALIDILSRRKAVNHAETVFSYTENTNNQVRIAAEKALKNVVEAKDLSRVAGLLDKAAGKESIAALQEALYACVQSIGDPEKQSQAIIAQMNRESANKTSYYNVLAMIGGEKGLPIVAKAFEKQEPSIRSTAFDALTQWNDFAVASFLFEIARHNPQGEYFHKALTAYVSKINLSKHPAEQKLLLLRKALEIAGSGEEKVLIIKEIAKTGTFTALMTIGDYLDCKDSKVQQTAVQSAFNIVQNNNRYYGKMVKNLLDKAIAVNKNPEAEYQEQAILKLIDSWPQEEGFASMFNGRDLTGWKGLVENPVARTKMTAKQLAGKQKEADKIMERDWKVENGILVYEGKGGENLCSEKVYADFEMFVDWKIEPEGDAGIYLRGSPQVQIWDTSRIQVGAQVGSGGLYNNKKYSSAPLVVADNPINEWNTFYIRMNGDKVVVYLNGQLVVDHVTMENYWDRNQSIFPAEAIELQAHGTRVSYRDIYIREIPRAQMYEVSNEEKKEGFASLFNGVDMSGWIGNLHDYAPADGMLVCDPNRGKGGHGNLYTEKEYADFILRFDFLLTPAANNGLGIRTPTKGDAAYVGMEIQILDNTAEVYKDLEEYQYHGSVYGVISAKRGALKPLGEWNSEEVSVIGNKIKVTLNGVVIVDGDIAEASNNFTQTLDGKKHPGLSNPSGHIGFLGHGSYVAFKNLRIKEVKLKVKN